MASIRKASKEVATWDRYFRRYRHLFQHHASYVLPGGARAWERLGRAVADRRPWKFGMRA